MTYFPFWQKLMALGAIWYGILSNNFQFLNNIICISTHFFTHTYFQKIQIILLEQRYQTDPFLIPLFII